MKVYQKILSIAMVCILGVSCNSGGQKARLNMKVSEVDGVSGATFDGGEHGNEKDPFTNLEHQDYFTKISNQRIQKSREEKILTELDPFLQIHPGKGAFEKNWDELEQWKTTGLKGKWKERGSNNLAGSMRLSWYVPSSQNLYAFSTANGQANDDARHLWRSQIEKSSNGWDAVKWSPLTNCCYFQPRDLWVKRITDKELVVLLNKNNLVFSTMNDDETQIDNWDRFQEEDVFENAMQFIVRENEILVLDQQSANWSEGKDKMWAIYSIDLSIDPNLENISFSNLQKILEVDVKSSGPKVSSHDNGASLFELNGFPHLIAGSKIIKLQKGSDETWSSSEEVILADINNVNVELTTSGVSSVGNTVNIVLDVKFPDEDWKNIFYQWDGTELIKKDINRTRKIDRPRWNTCEDTNTTQKKDFYSDMRSQHDVWVSKLYPEVIMYGNVDLIRSVDLLENGIRVESGYSHDACPEKILHSDVWSMRSWLISQGNEISELLFVTNDGGIHISEDQGETFDRISNGLRVGESNHHSTWEGDDVDYVGTGAQDQGRKIGVDSTGMFELCNFQTGDGFHVTSTDYGQNIWGSWQSGIAFFHNPVERTRKEILMTGNTSYCSPKGMELANWKKEPSSWTPYFGQRPFLPIPNQTYAFIAGKKFIKIGYDYQENKKTWEIISEEGFAWADPNIAEIPETETSPKIPGVDTQKDEIKALGHSFNHSNNFYAMGNGRNEKLLWYSRDAGVRWSSIDISNSITKNKWIDNILVSGENPNLLWIAGHGNGNSASYHGGIFKVTVSQEGSATLEDISKGFRYTEGFTGEYNVTEIIEFKNFLIASTTIGPYVYNREASSPQWYPIFGTEAPLIAYNDVEIVKNRNILRFSTWGRGIWDFEMPVDVEVESENNSSLSLSTSETDLLNQSTISTSAVNGSLVEITMDESSNSLKRWFVEKGDKYLTWADGYDEFSNPTRFYVRGNVKIKALTDMASIIEVRKTLGQGKQGFTENDVTVLKQQKLVYVGDQVEVVAEPHPGYRFAGWNIAQGGSGGYLFKDENDIHKARFDVKKLNDVVLYAVYLLENEKLITTSSPSQKGTFCINDECQEGYNYKIVEKGETVSIDFKTAGGYAHNLKWESIGNSFLFPIEEFVVDNSGNPMQMNVVVEDDITLYTYPEFDFFFKTPDGLPVELWELNQTHRIKSEGDKKQFRVRDRKLNKVKVPENYEGLKFVRWDFDGSFSVIPSQTEPNLVNFYAGKSGAAKAVYAANLEIQMSNGSAIINLETVQENIDLELNKTYALSAVGFDGHKFSHWEVISGEVEFPQGATSAQTSIIILSPASVRAVFKANDYSLTLMAQTGVESYQVNLTNLPAQGGSVNIEEGSQNLIKVNPLAGQIFSHWQVAAGQEQNVQFINSSSEASTLISLSGVATLTPVFKSQHAVQVFCPVQMQNCELSLQGVNSNIQAYQMVGAGTFIDFSMNTSNLPDGLSFDGWEVLSDPTISFLLPGNPRSYNVSKNLILRAVLK